jgi:hypothetical protein
MARRRFFQISIRTLLLLTTLIAVALGILARVNHRVQEQKIAVARIKAIGGQVLYNYEEGKSPARQTRTPPGWPWLRKLVGDEYFQDVVGITLDGTPVSDADLGVISRLRGMKTLSVNGREKTENSRYVIRKPFHYPEPVFSRITDDGIQRLGPQRNLQVAMLAHTSIGDEGVKGIALWPRLEVLNLEGTQVTSGGIELIEKLEHLKSLNLRKTKIDDSAVASLCRLWTLKQLDLTGTEVSGVGLFKLKAELPLCNLNGSFLDLSAVNIDPDPESMRWKEMTRNMWGLGRGNSLKLLILANPAVTDLHLSDLDRLEATDVIDLRHTKVTASGVETLQRALPKCKIIGP